MANPLHWNVRYFVPAFLRGGTGHDCFWFWVFFMLVLLSVFPSCMFFVSRTAACCCGILHRAYSAPSVHRLGFLIFGTFFGTRDQGSHKAFHKAF
jgi:hypothetical protein